MVGEGAIQSRRTVYVGGIADGATEATIRAAFVPFGPIKSIDIPRDYAKGAFLLISFVFIRCSPLLLKPPNNLCQLLYTHPTTQKQHTKHPKGTHRGFCFIEFDEPEDASEAIYNADGAEILGRALSVNLAQAHKHKLGSIKAVWTSDDWFREQSGETKEKEVGEEEERMKEDATILKDK